MTMTLYDYFESAKEAAIEANNHEAIDCFTWLLVALDHNKKKTVNPNVPPTEAAKVFAKAIHELTNDCFIFNGVEIGMRSNAPSETIREAVYLVLGPKLLNSWYVSNFSYLKCRYHYPFSGEYPESVSDFFRKLVIKVHEVEAEERKLVKMSRGLKPSKSIEDFGYNPQDTFTTVEAIELADKIASRNGSFTPGIYYWGEEY